MTQTSSQRTTPRDWPILSWVPGYQRGWLRPDVIAGLTVCAILVPEGMAYAQLAGMPAETAFYAAPVALLAYAILGSSRQLVVAVSSAHAGAPPAKKILGMVKNGYATASSATVTALQNNVATYGGATLTLSGVVNTAGYNGATSGLLLTRTLNISPSGAGLVDWSGTQISTSGSGPTSTVFTNPGTGTLTISGGATSVVGSFGNLPTLNGALTSDTSLFTNPITLSGIARVGTGTLNLSGTTSGANTSGPVVINSGNLVLNSNTLNFASVVVGQNGGVTLSNTSGSSFILGLSNGTTQTLVNGGSYTVTGAPYVTSISPVSGATSH
jgi:hypothetical protein